MSGLSVVMANNVDDAAKIERNLHALRRELGPADEVVFVDAAAAPRRPPDVAYVAAPVGSSRGDLYLRGLVVATHPLIAFTDSNTEVQHGWRDAAVGALGAGAAVVGGPVLPGTKPSMITTAGFLVEYGPHAADPFMSAGGDVAANNMAYRRDALEAVRVPPEPLWKTVVQASLRARGDQPKVVAGMRVVSTKVYAWRDVGIERLRHGRLYGAQRSATWTRCRCVAAAVTCVALPPVAYVRLARRLGPSSELRRALTRSTPVVSISLLLWSVGEAIGYLFGPATTTEVF